MWKRTLAVACGMFSLAFGGEAPASAGAIDGVVVDESLRPLVGARAWAERTDQWHGAVNFVDSDANGHFSIERLPLGTYHVFAEKEDDGYPDISFAFYGAGHPLTVTLSAEAPEASVVIKLGPKAGLLTGKIADAVTGAPLGATFKMWHLGKESTDLSTSGHPDYRVLIPPDIDVAVEVHLDGYETWYYPGYGAAASKPLRLRPGERMDLDIKLQPNGSAPPGK